MKIIYCIMIIVPLFLISCAVEQKSTMPHGDTNINRRSELINEIRSIDQRIVRKREITDLFSGEIKRLPENLDTFTVNDLEVLKKSMLELDCSLEFMWQEMYKVETNSLLNTTQPITNSAVAVPAKSGK